MSEGRMFTNVNDAMSFIQAGNATVTLVSIKSKDRHTFKISESDDGKLFFVARMVGPDNERSFQYVGIIRGGVFQTTKKSRDPIGFKVFEWAYRRLSNNVLPSDAMEIWHEGRCGACGRKLTVPESIERGIGPECAKGMMPARAAGADMMAQALAVA